MKNICKSFLLIIVVSLVFSSCSNNNIKSENPSNSIDADTAQSYFPIETFSKYEVFNSNSLESDFDKSMAENPIDLKLKADWNTLNSVGTREYQILLSEYAELWKDEMIFSISNLYNYLSQEQKEEFDKAQTAWEQSLSKTTTFDQNLINEKEINLGTQYVQSSLINGIEEYRNRVFYIKYMTMLCEVYIVNEVPENEQLWNVWSL